jgi:hypothetical protein
MAQPSLLDLARSYSMGVIETIKINDPKRPGKYRIINLIDLDLSKHELYDPDAYAEQHPLYEIAEKTMREKKFIETEIEKSEEKKPARKTPVRRKPSKTRSKKNENAKRRNSSNKKMP